MDAEQRKRIEELYLEMFEKMMAYARSAFNSEPLAEEAVQETFWIACQKPDQLCGSENPQGWLVITLKNIILHMKSSRERARRIIERYVMPQAAEHTILEDKVELRVLYEDVVDTEEFKLLVELAIEGKSHEEMARGRGISVSACKKRVQRAKEILQKKLKNNVT